MSDSEESIPQRHLVLHFDLNRTILTHDPYDHIDSIEIFLCDVVAKMAWGEVTFPEGNDEGLDEEQKSEKYKTATWTLKNEELSLDFPKKGLISFRQYLDILFYVKRANNDKEMDEQAITMKERNFRLLEFISNEGKVFKERYDQLRESVKLPKGCELKAEVPDKLKESYNNGRFQVIPAFFNTLKTLFEQKREFSVVFRTHGRELQNIIDEFNNFCEGNHPAYNGYNCEKVTFNDKKTRDLRIKDRQTGMYFRFGRELSDVSLMMNTLERFECKNHDDILENYGGQIEEGTITLHSDSIEENYEIIMENLRKHGSMGIQDDFYAYFLNKDDNSFGKLLLVDQSDFSLQHVFFDDLARVGDTCNIDVRDLSTGDKILDKKFRNKYVVRANIYEAIIDNEYFLKHIETCERARDREIERLQEGILSSEDEVEVQSINEWEKLQNLSNEDYLCKTVAPLLYQGLNLISTERPTNPVEFLALYMLQNKDLVKIPNPQ